MSELVVGLVLGIGGCFFVIILLRAIADWITKPSPIKIPSINCAGMEEIE